MYSWVSFDYGNKQDRQHTYKRNTEVRSGINCCSGKAISITYSEFMSIAIIIQHANRMRLNVLASVAYLVLQYFKTLSHKRHVSREKVIENE
jgi:hypothetical protein